MSIVVNLFGGPGIGKSTTSSGVFSLLKMHDVNAELISEFAKDLVWEKRYKTFENQYYISTKQYHRQWRVKYDVDVIITDSPLLLGGIYSKEQKVKDYVKNLYDEFENINYILVRNKKYNPIGRNQNLKEAIEIDEGITKALHNYPLEFIKGDFTAVNHITKNILGILNKKMKFSIKEEI